MTGAASEVTDDPRLVKQIEESDGPPEGVPSTGIEMIVDEGQRTAVVIQYYDNAEDMAEGERVFGAMDASETPGTRAASTSA